MKKATGKNYREAHLYHRGYEAGFIDGKNEGLKLVEKIIKTSSIGKSFVIPKGYVLVLSDKPEKADFESNPDGKPMRIIPVEESEGK